MAYPSHHTYQYSFEYQDTLTQGVAGGWRDYLGISRDCQSYFGVPRYSDTGGGWWIGSPWISQDCQSYFGVPGYSDTGGWLVDGGIILEYPGTVRVTLEYRNTLTQGVAGGLAVTGYPGTVRVTMEYWDTLTQGGGWWMEGLSWDIPGLSELLWSTGILWHRVQCTCMYVYMYVHNHYKKSRDCYYITCMIVCMHTCINNPEISWDCQSYLGSLKGQQTVHGSTGHVWPTNTDASTFICEICPHTSLLKHTANF